MVDISKKFKGMILTCLFLFSAVFPGFTESVWEGSAAMGRYGEFPFTGFYGASNSFPQNSYVEVENLDNGKRTRLIIVNRLSDPGLLMLVSTDAAAELGIYQSDVTRIKVRLLTNSPASATSQFDDLAYNPDPDINPAAALKTPEELVVAGETEARSSGETAQIAAAAEPEKGIEASSDVNTVEQVKAPENPVTEADTAETPVWSGNDETAGRTTDAGEPSIADNSSPRTDGLKEAEILVDEGEVPANIAADSPEKPFDWPDSLEKPEQAPEPDPLYLTMDKIDDASPGADNSRIAENVPSPETEVLWPDSSTADDKKTAKFAEPLKLTDGDLDFASPAADDARISENMPSPETEVLWPDDSVPGSAAEAEAAEPMKLSSGDLDFVSPGADALPGSDKLEFPESRLELLSSGLAETAPSSGSDDNFNISMLPDLIEKEPAEPEKPAEPEQILTDSSDYHTPGLAEPRVLIGRVPAPEPSIPEEVIAALVGDDLDMYEAEPEAGSSVPGYLDSPEIVEKDGDFIIPDLLADAEPDAETVPAFNLAALPVLEAGEETSLVDAADGYRFPEKEEYTAEINDYPEVAAADEEPSDIPRPGDELAYAEAGTGDDAALPEMTDLPELAEAEDEGSAAAEGIETAVPEYDENLEVSLVPAEVRPPELDSKDTGLLEGEPETETLPGTDIAEDTPEVSNPSVVDAEGVTAPAVPSESAAAEPAHGTAEVPGISKTEAPPVAVAVVPGTPAVNAPTEPPRELIVPGQVEMVSKLQQQRHYIQLGAFKEKNSALKAAGRLEMVYPVTILTDEAPTGVTYKLLLGPLSADESGIMLYNFKAGGYADAFIRRIE